MLEPCHQYRGFRKIVQFGSKPSTALEAYNRYGARAERRFRGKLCILRKL